MILEEQHDIIRILQSFKKKNKQYEYRFTCTKEIEFPYTAFSQINLTSLIGKRIGIFNFNGYYSLIGKRIGIFNFNGYYKIRIMEEKK